VIRKRSNQIGIRLTDAEADALYKLSDQSGISVSELFRRFLGAAVDFFGEHDGWPREIAVVKKTTRPLDENVEKKGAHFTRIKADAALEPATKRPPRPHPAAKP